MTGKWHKKGKQYDEETENIPMRCGLHIFELYHCIYTMLVDKKIVLYDAWYEAGEKMQNKYEMHNLCTVEDKDWR